METITYKAFTVTKDILCNMSPLAASFQYGCLSILAAPIATSITKKRIIIEIDQSESMKQMCGDDQTRLEKVLETVIKVIKYLFREEYNATNVWIGINSYNDRHQVHIEPMQITGKSVDEQEQILHRFETLFKTIRPDGFTNIENPIRDFVEQIKEKEPTERLRHLRDALLQNNLSLLEISRLTQELSATCQALMEEVQEEDFLILLTDGQITKGMDEKDIVATYLQPNLNAIQSCRLYFIGFGKEHSATGLDTLDRGIGNYFSVISGVESTAIAAAEIIFRIVRPGPQKVVLTTLLEEQQQQQQPNQHHQIFNALKNTWESQISLGMLTPGKRMEFYTRISKEMVGVPKIEITTHNDPVALQISLEGELSEEETTYSVLRLESLQFLGQVKLNHYQFRKSDFITQTKKMVFKELYVEASHLLEKLHQSDEGHDSEMTDLYNDVKTCLLTMGGYSSVSELYNLSRLNAQWFGSCMRNAEISHKDITSQIYDSTGTFEVPLAPVSLGRQYSEATPTCLVECMRSVSQQLPSQEEEQNHEPSCKRVCF